MTKNPFVNALAATAYITLIASALSYVPNTDIPEKSVMIPIVMLSLLVLSAALMGYFFFYQPVRLLIENKQKEATKLFLLTVLIFACITAAMAFTWFFLSALL